MPDRKASNDTDLKRREYRDEDGRIHHHTHPYMEEHRGSASRETARERSGGERKQSHTADHAHTSGSHTSHMLTEHDAIQRWAEERGAEPSCVKGTGRGNDVGMIRLDFPGFSGGDSLEHISWDEWFKAFDQNDLGLLVQDRTTDGQRSNFNKLVNRKAHD